MISVVNGFDPAANCGMVHPPAELPEQVALASAQRLAGVGSWVWEPPRGGISWSDEACAVLGMRPADYDGTPEGFFQFVHPQDRAHLRHVLDAAFAGTTPFSYHFRLQPPGGGERVIEGEGEVHFDAGGAVLRLLGTVKDVTLRERERQALHQSEQRFRSLVALSSDWYWEQDAELRFTEFTGHNPAGQENRHQALGQRRWELPDWLPIGFTWEEHRALLAARRPFRGLEMRQGRGAATRYVSVSGEPFYGPDGAFQGYRGTCTDITERHAAEDRLRQVNTSLRMAMRLGRIGVWSMDVEGCRLNWWSGGRVIHALAGDPAENLEQLLQRVDSGQRSELARALECCLSEGQAFELEVCLLPGLHPLMWVQLIGEPHLDADGRVVQVRGTVQDVTERRLAGKRARQLGNRLVAPLDTGADGFLTVSRDWTITYLNPEAEGLLCRSRHELLGCNLWAEFPQAAGGRFEQEYRRALSTGETVEFEDYYEPLRMWVQTRAHPSPRGLAIYFRDITDRHSVQLALADSQEHLRNLFENTLDAVLYTRGADEIVRLNPAACAIFGLAPPELRGRRLVSLIAPGEQRFALLREQRGMTGHASGQLTMLRGDGSEFQAEVSSAEYPAADGSLCAFVVLRDISQRLRDEQEIRQLNAELSQRVSQRTAELEAANAELKAFAHSLAHDLQSPIAAIDGYSELLESVLPKPLPQRGAHYLGRIRNAARKTSEYAQGLLALARLSQAVLSVTRVDLSAMATDLLTQLSERDSLRQVRWRVQPGLAADGDPTLLRMALENLLGNAWKFTRDAASARIEFAGDEPAQGPAVYRVRDNGAGFDMAYAHRLFGNFQRLHSQQEFPGTGVGLANVQRVVARHGGRVWAEAAVGAGACFYFTLAPSEAPSVK